MELFAFGIIWIAITIIAWVIAIVFLVLTIVFFKKKIARWVLGSLTLLFISIPFLFYWALQIGHANSKEAYAGIYSSKNADGSKITLTLKEDSFMLISDKCETKKIEGYWDYFSGDENIYINFYKEKNHETNDFITQASIGDDRKSIYLTNYTFRNCSLEGLTLTKE